MRDFVQLLTGNVSCTVWSTFRLAASVPQSGPRDDERLLELATASKAARIERNKLARKLQLERHAEGGIADKVFVARHPARDLVRSGRNDHLRYH